MNQRVLDQINSEMRRLRKASALNIEEETRQHDPLSVFQNMAAQINLLTCQITAMLQAMEVHGRVLDTDDFNKFMLLQMQKVTEGLEAKLGYRISESGEVVRKGVIHKPTVFD